MTLAQNNNMTFSAYILSLFDEKENKIDEFNKGGLKLARKKKTELHFNLFHMANTLDTIVRMSKNSFIGGRGKKFNMEPIILVINEANKIYRKMPLRDRKALEWDMQNLNELKDVENLKEMLGFRKILDGKPQKVNEITFNDGKVREKLK